MKRALVLALFAGTLSAASPADAGALPYQDPSLPVPQRVDDLLARMSLDDKLGQMTQAERAVVTPADLTQCRIGSVLSGGGSAPAQNSPAGWADMYDNLQKLHGHRYLVTDVLKGELGFTRFTVSDWAGIDQIDGQRGFTQAEVAQAINATFGFNGSHTGANPRPMSFTLNGSTCTTT